MPNFCKEERLSMKRHIYVLQKEGNVFFNFPFKIKWIELPILQKNKVQILPAISKNNFKKAVDRNHIKRLIREAYRRNKSLLLKKTEEKEKNIAIMFHYTGRETITYKETDTKIALILKQIADQI